MSSFPRASRRSLALGAILAAGSGAPRAQPFDPPINVSQSASGSFVPSMTRDRGGPDEGTLRLFWHDFTGTTNLVWCSDTLGGSFSAGAICATNVRRSFAPQAASDSQGRTHVVWRDLNAGADEIFHSVHDGVAWSTPLNVSATAGGSRNPVIAIDALDRPHVLWQEDPGGAVSFYETHFDGTSWSAAGDTGLPFVLSAFVDTLRVACDGTGTLHATWHDGASSLTEVYHSERPDGGTWSAPTNVSDTQLSLSAEPAIAVGPDDALHLAWVEQDASGTSFEIAWSTRPAGGAWSTGQDVTSFRSDVARPSVAVGSDAMPRFSFSVGPSGARDVFYVVSPTSTPVAVATSPGDSARSVLVLDDADAAIIAWQEGNVPTPEIFVAFESGTAPTPVLLMVAKDEAAGDVLLAWTGGAAPFTVARTVTVDGNPPGWPTLTPAGGTAASAWTDAGVLRDGRLLFYDVR